MAGIDERNPYAAPGAEVLTAQDDRVAEAALRAPLWRRVLALLIDASIVGVCLGVVTLGGFVSINNEEFVEANAPVLVVLATTVALIFAWLYGSWMEWRAGNGTLGKRVTGIRVVDLCGQSPTLLHCAERNLAKILSVGLYGVGLLAIPFTRRRQAFHDWLAGTQVYVKARDLVEE